MRAVSPGMTLATSMVKTLGLRCSKRDALFPSSFASSYSSFASSFSLIVAVTLWLPISMVMPWTVAVLEVGNTYWAFMGLSPSFT